MPPRQNGYYYQQAPQVVYSQPVTYSSQPTYVAPQRVHNIHSNVYQAPSSRVVADRFTQRSTVSRNTNRYVPSNVYKKPNPSYKPVNYANVNVNIPVKPIEVTVKVPKGSNVYRGSRTRKISSSNLAKTEIIHKPTTATPYYHRLVPESKYVTRHVHSSKAQYDKQQAQIEAANQAKLKGKQAKKAAEPKKVELETAEVEETKTVQRSDKKAQLEKVESKEIAQGTEEDIVEIETKKAEDKKSEEKDQTSVYSLLKNQIKEVGNLSDRPYLNDYHTLYNLLFDRQSFLNRDSSKKEKKEQIIKLLKNTKFSSSNPSNEEKFEVYSKLHKEVIDILNSERNKNNQKPDPLPSTSVLPDPKEESWWEPSNNK